MGVLKIKIFPDEGLRKKSLPVLRISEEDKRLIRDMIETMYVAQGVGLAAPQVGVNKRIFVASPNGERGKEWIVINPRIIEKKGKVYMSEGCLSFPRISLEIKRYEKIVVRFENIEGKEMTVPLEKLEARIFQHELDHLEGILFIDRIGIMKRWKILRRFKEISLR